MKKQVYRIDENGFIKETLVAEFDDNDNLVDELEDVVTIQPIHGLYRPKWTGTEWVAGMSQAEIDALNNQPKPPTIEEQLAKKDEQILELKEKQVATNRAVDETSTTVQQLLELLDEQGVIS